MGHRRLGRVGRGAAIAGGLFLALVTARVTVAGELTVLYERGRVTVVAEDVALGDVVGEVGRQAGVEVHGTGDLRDPVTMHFADASLDGMLRRLLARVSYVLVLEATLAGDQPRPTQAYLFGAHRPRPSPAHASGARLAARPEPGFFEAGHGSGREAAVARPASPPDPTAERATGLAGETPSEEHVETFGPAALTPGAEDEYSPTPEG